MRERILRYQAYNKSRKINAIGFNPKKATLLFKVIPYLLHCNYPDLPGFVDDPHCPFGIYRFLPDKIVDSELFRAYFPDSTARNQKTPSPYPKNPCIHSLKTIGSIGTIAQSEKSDCDFWVSIRLEELGESGFSLLQQKCKKIEKWAGEQGIEVYFFLMDIDQTRENSFSSVAEEESAGSALKLLLKDELFRTHILVAGKMLLWWLIPPGLTEEEYRGYVEELVRSRSLNLDSFVDLGYLSDIPKEEIFGACLWQLNKALDSPFKSVIKFAYLELLLKHKTKILPLFSTKIQCLVTFPEQLPRDEVKLPLNHIDPYLLLAKEIVAFYQKNKIKDEDDLIRECLFFKTLEGTKSRKNDAHLRTILALMEKWDLLPPDYERMTQLQYWNYKELLSFGARVHAYLLDTYNRLRWLRKSFQDDTGRTISDRDLSILGKKLFSFYDVKPDKIPYLHTLSRQAMRQPDLTFHLTRYEGAIYYYVFQGILDAESIKNNQQGLIKRETDPVLLLIWLVINGIMQQGTIIHLTKNFLAVHLSDLQNLANILIKTFPLVNFSQISATELLSQEKVTMALIIVNFEKEAVKGSQTLQSSIITVNNYGEYYHHHYTSLIQLKNAMRLLLTRHFVSRWNNNMEIYIPDQPEKHYIQSQLEK
ncbi:MAG: class I adenylate cyclase [Deltaproteobacteria bacterium]|nr:class I adenylate cyclase [Deltaproteobacteria bacterium]